MASYGKDDKVQIVTETSSGNPMKDKHVKIMIMMTVCAVIASSLAIILAIVGLSTGGPNQFYITPAGNGATSGQRTSGPDKIWLFQTGHIQSRTQYLDEKSGTIKGYNIDVVNAVCQIANKNCELVYDLFERCWDSQAGERPRGGIGLMGGWYDACVGWLQTFDRARTFRFTNPFNKIAFAVAVTASRSDITTLPSSFTGLKVGFVDGMADDEHCANRIGAFKDFNPEDAEQITHYQSLPDLFTALKDQEVDLAFHINYTFVHSEPGVNVIWESSASVCIRGGVSVMMRADQIELQTWWNAAFDRLKGTSQYEDICERLSTTHAELPGKDGKDFCVQ